MASRDRAKSGAGTDRVSASGVQRVDINMKSDHGDSHRNAGQRRVDPFADETDGSGLPEELDAPATGSALDSAIHTLIAAIRQEFARERRREREKLKVVFQQRVRQLEIEANQRVREKLSRARVRDREKLLDREHRLDTMFAQLNDLAKEVASQKRQLKKSREEFEQKLMESDFIQTELRHLGKQIGEQIDTFGDSLPDDSFIDDMDRERKAG